MSILTQKDSYLNEPIGLKMLNDDTAFKIEATASSGYTEISKYENHFVLDTYFDYTYEETRDFLSCTASQFQQLSESEKVVVIDYLSCFDENGDAETAALTNYLINNKGYSSTDASKKIQRKETQLNIYAPSANNGSTYFKDSVIVTTSSDNFNSSAPVNVPGLTYTITKDGDYTFYAILNRKKKDNDLVDLFFAKNGTTLTNSVSTDEESRNKDKSAQNMFLINNLVIGDVITIQMDTNGKNVDLNNRRMIIQSWG